MDRNKFNIGLKKFKQAFSETDLNALGKRHRFAQKFRKATPFRLATSLISCFAERKIETIADTHRAFNELNTESIQYKPYHNQLAKYTFPDFMREVVSRLLSEFAIRSLTIAKDNPFSRFKNILIHDGSSYAIKSDLKKIYPGKFKKQAPAAVQLHTTMGLREDEALSVTLVPFKEADANYSPAPEEISESLLLADRAYLDFTYFRDIDENKGYFIVRGKRHMNPVIKEAYDGQGKKIRRVTGKKLKEITLTKNKLFDLEGEWKIIGGSVNCRLVISWDKKNKAFSYFVTNLPRKQFTAEHILNAYKLRWQVELLFKEWKSYANLKKFDTANRYIMEGLIWAALGAAIVKRFIAHVTQCVKETAISTRIVAMCIGRKISILFEKLIRHELSKIEYYFTEMIHYLGDNAKRTYQQRERKKGRGQLGFVAFTQELKN